MSTHASPAQGREIDGWPPADAEGRPVRFTSGEPRPRPDEYEPVLIGTALRLEPMREAHVDALCRVGLDPAVTRYMPIQLTTPVQMEEYVRDAVAARAAGTAIPFVTVLKEAGFTETVVGTTRFGNIDPPNRRMEIGWTWIGLQWQRTRVNTEAKYLMLRHAFEELGCLRIEFKVDTLNARSRAALLRIGAVPEGVFRNHVITAEGRIRHTAFYSVTVEEWPAVKVRLEGMLSRPA